MSPFTPLHPTTLHKASSQGQERVMRIVKTAWISFVLAGIPSVSFAQVIVPCFGQGHTTTTRIPVAAVTRLEDPVGLANSQPEDTFVLGAATLDMRDPACTRIAFTLINQTETPLSLANV